MAAAMDDDLQQQQQHHHHHHQERQRGEEAALLLAAQESFREAVQLALAQLRDSGVERRAAVGRVLRRIRSGREGEGEEEGVAGEDAGAPLWGSDSDRTEAQALQQQLGLSEEEAIQIMVVRTEHARLMASGLSELAAVRKLTARLRHQEGAGGKWRRRAQVEEGTGSLSSASEDLAWPRGKRPMSIPHNSLPSKRAKTGKGQLVAEAAFGDCMCLGECSCSRSVGRMSGRKRPLPESSPAHEDSTVPVDSGRCRPRLH